MVAATDGVPVKLLLKPHVGSSRVDVTAADAADAPLKLAALAESARDLPALVGRVTWEPAKAVPQPGTGSCWIRFEGLIDDSSSGLTPETVQVRV